MKLKYAYSFQSYGDRYLAAADYFEAEAQRRLIWVNETGKAVMELLSKDITREELLDALAARYAGDPALIEKAADAFLAQLSSAGILAES